jgi:hypothetical protein
MIRASGGKVTVRVKRNKASGLGIRAYLDQALGAWTWTVPAPKGHPRTPSWETLHGRAHTMQDAVRDGLNRLAEVYGGQR